MNSLNTIAGTAGRISGTTVRVARELNALIDWREVAAIVWQMLVAMAVLTFHAGRLTGRGVHRLNDWLAAAWRGLLVPAVNTSAQPVSTAYTFTSQQPIAHPLADLAAQLEALTVRELMAMTGSRRKLSKARLVALALAI